MAFGSIINSKGFQDSLKQLFQPPSTPTGQPQVWDGPGFVNTDRPVNHPSTPPSEHLSSHNSVHHDQCMNPTDHVDIKFPPKGEIPDQGYGRPLIPPHNGPKFPKGPETIRTPF